MSRINRAVHRYRGDRQNARVLSRRSPADHRRSLTDVAGLVRSSPVRGPHAHDRPSLLSSISRIRRLATGYARFGLGASTRNAAQRHPSGQIVCQRARLPFR